RSPSSLRRWPRGGPDGLSPQRLEHVLRRNAVCGQAVLRLERGDSSARSGAEVAVDRAVIVAESLEAGLDLELLADVERAGRARPVLIDAAIAGDLVGEQADCQGIEVGIIIMLDDVEVARHQEDRAVRPAG